MDAHKKYRQWCIVPGCGSTSTKNPSKLFFYVPRNPKQRNLWIRAVRRNPSEFSKTSTIFVCDDHFNVEEDMENYVKFKLMGGQKKLKNHVVPHIFACQADRKRAAPKSCRQGTLKRARQQFVEEILSNAADISANVSDDPTFLVDEELHIPPISTETEISTTASKSSQTISPPRTYYRSKFVQCKILSGKSIACSPFKISVDASMSPPTFGDRPTSSKKQPPCINLFKAESSDTDENSSQHESDSLYTTTDSEHSLQSSSDEQFDESWKEIKAISLKRIHRLIPLQSRLYLGLPKDSFYLINLLVKYTPLPVTNIYLTLKKIRTNHTFAELADDFGTSESNASRIFGKAITLISGNMCKLIVWPSRQKIKEILPLPFIANYSNVQAIIDCLEIEIEKPQNPIHQSLTWSEYKRTNTLKYLISATPNGIINFISTRFGGRTSDSLIVEKSGFLEKLPAGSAVMADRGFKHVDHLLRQNHSLLVRPPSVDRQRKSTKAEVLETKRIASLRIHIERVIRRIREFKMLKPHSCLNRNLLQYTDHVIVVACALANLQAALIK